MHIGHRIRNRRIELEWSQRELADKMGCNHSTITRIETGKIDIQQSRIVQFAEVLNVSIAYLMGWEEDEEETGKPIEDNGLSAKKQALIDFAMSIPDDKAEMILKVIRSIVESD